MYIGQYPVIPVASPTQSFGDILQEYSRFAPYSCGPGGNRTPASAMRMPRNATLLQAQRKTHECPVEGTCEPGRRARGISQQGNIRAPRLDTHASFLGTHVNVGVPGIEPGPHTPEACILPLYYTPMEERLAVFRAVVYSKSCCGPTGSRTRLSSMPWTRHTDRL